MRKKIEISIFRNELANFVITTSLRLTAKLQRFSFEDQDRTAKFCGLGMKTKTAAVLVRF
jgi:hypothetical protein